MEKESQLDCVLYLMPNYPLLTYVATLFERCTKPVYFALADEFQRNTLDAMVMDSRRLKSLTLHALLDANARQRCNRPGAMPSH